MSDFRRVVAAELRGSRLLGYDDKACSRHAMCCASALPHASQDTLVKMAVLTDDDVKKILDFCRELDASALTPQMGS